MPDHAGDGFGEDGGERPLRFWLERFGGTDELGESLTLASKFQDGRLTPLLETRCEGLRLNGFDVDLRCPFGIGRGACRARGEVAGTTARG